MADTKNGSELHPQPVKLAQGANYGSTTTMLPNGNFQTQLLWVHTDDERLVANTEVHRQKFKNAQREPRVTLTIRNEQDPTPLRRGLRQGRGAWRPSPVRRLATT